MTKIYTTIIHSKKNNIDRWLNNNDEDYPLNFFLIKHTQNLSN